VGEMMPETEQKLKYKAIKAFLFATKNLLKQYNPNDVSDLALRVYHLETLLENTYLARDYEGLTQIHQNPEHLANDLLSYLKKIESPYIVDKHFFRLKA
jgi:hypothetical protein